MTVRLGNWDDVLQQLDGIRRAPASALDGPWPLPVALAHCAQSIELSMIGYPVMRSALFRATLGRLAKRRFLARGVMSHDRAAPIPGAPAVKDESLSPALGRLRGAIAAFQAFHGELAPHLAYGKCTKVEYERLHAMHVADHLSLLRG